MLIICAIVVTQNDTNLFSHFYIAATFIAEELNFACFAQKDEGKNS